MVKERENQVLKQVTRQIYQDRDFFPPELLANYRIERVNNGNFGDVWFMTRGCSHDIGGGCTMCNYGKGNRVPEEKILENLKKILSEMPEDYEEFVISPVGNILDSNEVSEHMMAELGKLWKHIRCKTLITESRADLITAEGLARLKQTFNAELQCVELGIESGDDWVLRNCVNKGMVTEDYRHAIRMIKDAGMYAVANIGIGIPFMSERMAIEHAIKSIHKSLTWGADSIVLFPYHVKPGTLASWLYGHKEYAPVSLWSLVEILVRLEPEVQDITRISWYKNYYEEPWRIIASPSTCDACYADVLVLLEEYKNSMRKETLDILQEYSCDCKSDWKEKLLDQPEEIDMPEIERQYRMMAEAFKIAPELLEDELEYMKHTRGW